MPSMQQRASWIHLEPVGGIAGDMFVAAALDAFPHLREPVLAAARAVLPEGAGRAVLTEGTSGSLRVLRFGLETAGVPVAHVEHGHHHPHGHDHHHDRGQEHDHGHGHDHGPHAGHHHPHRHEVLPAEAAAHRPPTPRSLFPALLSLIRQAPLDGGVIHHAGAILTLLAEAEAKVHGIPVEEVHFHEIADWDSLLDVVAAGCIAAALDHVRWSVGALPRGGGLVRTQHGLLPVPAPATAALLEGYAWRDDGVAGERVTPTGAAILRHLAPPPAGAVVEGRLLATGYGAGTRTLPGMPNILRLSAFGSDSGGASEGDEVVVTEFDVDDMTGEEIAAAQGRLLDLAGVLDVSLATRSGKKGRLSHEFRILCRPDAARSVHDECFRQTATIGLRYRSERRRVLERWAVTARDGTLRGKASRRPGGDVTVKVESDDLADAATLSERRALTKTMEERD